MRLAQAVAQRVPDPPGNGAPRLGQCDQHAEGRFSGGKIVGAVERVDDPAQRIAQPVHQRRVGMGGLFAHNGRFGEQAGQTLRQDRLAGTVSHGDDIVGGLGLDLAGAEALVMWQDRLFRRRPHHCGNRWGQGQRHER